MCRALNRLQVTTHELFIAFMYLLIGSATKLTDYLAMTICNYVCPSAYLCLRGHKNIFY